MLARASVRDHNLLLSENGHAQAGSESDRPVERDHDRRRACEASRALKLDVSRAAEAGDVVRTLNPIVLVDGKRFSLLTHRIGTIPKKRLPHPKLDLPTEHDHVVRALDMLFQGF